MQEHPRFEAEVSFFLNSGLSRPRFCPWAILLKAVKCFNAFVLTRPGWSPGEGHKEDCRSKHLTIAYSGQPNTSCRLVLRTGCLSWQFEEVDSIVCLLQAIMKLFFKLSGDFCLTLYGKGWTRRGASDFWLSLAGVGLLCSRCIADGYWSRTAYRTAASFRRTDSLSLSKKANLKK